MRLSLVAPALFLLLGCGAGASLRDSASPVVELRGQAASNARSLARAMERRMTVWTRHDGTPVFARQCRQAPGGCSARLQAFARIFAAEASRHDLDPYLLAGLAMRESSFDPAALGRAGEAGIVQLHPRGEGHDMRFVRDRSYRRRCLRRVDACQQPVVERAAESLARSLSRCGSLSRALGRYASGSCNRGLSHADHVFEERDRLREPLLR